MFTGVGERTREGNDLYGEMTESGVINKTALVYGQMNEPPGARMRVALSGLTMAEYFRDVKNQDVLLFIDNIFRFTQAGSEVSALLGRMPSAVGYQPTLATEMGALQERITSTRKGSITSVQAVYVPADDLTDPAPATTFTHLDATTVLSRDIASQGIYPAVDPLDSTSRILSPEVVGQEHYEIARAVQKVLQRYKELQDIIAIMGMDELSEEDKEQNFVNDAKDAFVAAEVKKAIKAREVEPATMSILKDVDALFAEEKTLKKQVKDDSAALHQRTKGVIERLTDEEVRDLLHRKWILPLMENLNSLPDAVLDDFVKQLDAVCKKYETTFEDVESQIASTEHELLGLLDDLQGNEFDMQGIAELKKLLGGE